MSSRRQILSAVPVAAASLLAFGSNASSLLQAQHSGSRDLRITGFDFIPVRATERTVWLFIRLRTAAGLTGLGEASDAFGYSNTSRADLDRMRQILSQFYALIDGRSALEIERFRHAGWAMAKQGGLPTATAFCAFEQAMWDLSGHALGVPCHQLWGGKVRDRLPVYANINRATRQRTPEGFAGSARKAVAEGYRSLKAAPFDGYPRQGSATEIARHVDNGVACVMAMREAVGDAVKILIDCHSFFSVEASIALAKRLEPARLGWFEEPLPPTQVPETKQIKDAIAQPMAGGEFLFAVEGFSALCQQKAVDVIMPDAKFCGGLLEMNHIAAMAFAHGVTVAPHNPSGPVCTMATAQVCAGMRNFQTLEMQWGEVPWRGDLLNPPERFVSGELLVSDAPGFGATLNDALVKQHPA
jgi:galactonate dehydratase